MQHDLDSFPAEYSVSTAKQQSAQAAAAQQHAAAAYAYEQVQAGSAAAYPPLTQSPLAPYSVAHSSHQSDPLAQSLSGSLLDPAAAEMHAQHRKAIRQWGWRVKGCFALHLVAALCLLRSYYWFTTVIGVVLLIGILLFAYSIKLRQTHFVLLYLLVVLVNLAKNVIILLFFFRQIHKHDELSAYEIFLVALMMLDAALLTPFSIYSCFYLYRSIALTHLTF